jgi:hypothetical protein
MHNINQIFLLELQDVFGVGLNVTSAVTGSNFWVRFRVMEYLEFRFRFGYPNRTCSGT